MTGGAVVLVVLIAVLWITTHGPHYGSPTAKQWHQLKIATISVKFASAALANCDTDRISDDVDPATAEAELKDFTSRYDLSAAQKQVLDEGATDSTTLSMSLTEGGTSGENCFEAQQLLNGVVGNIRSGKLAEP